jgi:integrase
MPPRPQVDGEANHVEVDPQRPYERIAATLRQRIVDGDVVGGNELPELPTNRMLAEQFRVSAATAQRAVKMLESWGLVVVKRGLRTRVVTHRQAPTSREQG